HRLRRIDGPARRALVRGFELPLDRADVRAPRADRSADSRRCGSRRCAARRDSGGRDDGSARGTVFHRPGSPPLAGPAVQSSAYPPRRARIVLRLGRPEVSVRLDRRVIQLFLVVSLVTFAGVVVTLVVGRYPVPLDQIWMALQNQASHTNQVVIT